MNGAEPFVFCYDISDAALPKRAALNNIFSCIYCVKDVQIRSFSGPYFLVFGLNTEIYGVNLRVQSEYWKIQARKNSVFGPFFRSDFLQ